MPEASGSFDLGGGLGGVFVDNDGYTSLAMLCQEWSDGDDDNNDDDDDDDTAYAQTNADVADKLVRRSPAAQTAFLRELERPSAAEDPELAPTEVAAEEGPADSD